MDFQMWWELAQKKYKTDASPADVASVLHYAHKETTDGQQQLPAWIIDAVETYRQRMWALWDVAFQLPAAPVIHARLNTRNGTEKRGEHSRQLPDQEAQPESGKVHDLEADSVSPGSYTIAYLTTNQSGAGFPPDPPVRLPDRLEDGKAVLHVLFLGLLPVVPDADHDADIINRLIAGFEAVHAIWHSVKEQDAGASLKHPLAPFIEGWLLRPVEADERATGILPATLAAVREADGPAALFDLGEYEKTAGFAPHPIAQAFLPGLAPVGNEIVPAAIPLLMWDASSQGGPRRGKGAPLSLRIWIEAVLALPTADRRGMRRVSVRYGDLVDWLMPNRRYEQGSWPGVQTALHRVHNLRLPWQLPDGTGGSRAVVVVRDAPRVWNAYDDQVTFEISLPPGVNERGPLVYRPALRWLGQQSAMRYRAELGLSWLWDRYGARNGRYTQPTRPLIARDGQDRMLDITGAILLDKNGQPARTYTVTRKSNGQHARIARPGIVPLDADGRPVPTLAEAATERNPAADHYPVLTPAQLVELCYPLNLTGKRLTQSAVRSRRNRAQEAIQLMADQGYCIAEDVDGGWRILPPQGWGAGYGG